MAMAAMLAVDLRFIVRVGDVGRRHRQCLDEAKRSSRRGKGRSLPYPRLHQPRQMVYVESKGVEEGRGLLHRTLWWVSAQAGLRTV